MKHKDTKDTKKKISNKVFLVFSVASWFKVIKEHLC
jgi:hypothetical protein